MVKKNQKMLNLEWALVQLAGIWAANFGVIGLASLAAHKCQCRPLGDLKVS